MLEDRYPSDPYDYAKAADDMAEVVYQDTYVDPDGCFDLEDDKNNYWYTLGITGLIDAFVAADVHTGEIPGLLTLLFDCQYPGGAFSYYIKL